MGKDYSKKKSTIQDAKIWYESFKKIMEFEGIKLDNPYALSRVNICNPVPTIKEDESNTKKIVDFCNKTSNIYSLAFMPMDKKGAYKEKKKDNEDLASWIFNRTQKAGELPDSEILKLYNAARENRLVIQPDKVQAEDKRTPKYVYVNTSGKCSVTGPMTEHINDDILMLSQAGFTKEDAQNIAEYRNLARGAVSQKGDFMYNILDDKASDRNDSYTKEQHKKDIANFNQLSAISLLAKMGSLNPEWIGSPERRKTVSNVASALIVHHDYRADGTEELIDNNLILSDKGNEALESIVKKYNKKKDPNGNRIIEHPLEEILNQGKITDAKGNPYPGEDNFAVMNNVLKDALNGKAVYIEGQANIVDADAGFLPAVKTKTYIDFVQQFKESFEEKSKGIEENRLNTAGALSAMNTFLSIYEEGANVDSSSALMATSLGSINYELGNLAKAAKELGELNDNEKELLKLSSVFNKVPTCAKNGVYNLTNEEIQKIKDNSVKREKVDITEKKDIVKFEQAKDQKLFQLRTFGLATSGKQTESRPLNLALADDCKRICKYDPIAKKMTYPLYDEAANKKYSNDQKAHFEFIQGKNLEEIYDSGEYFYFKAGSNEPLRIEGKDLKPVDIDALDEDIAIALNNECQQRTDDELVQAKERRNREAELFNYKMSLYNSTFENVCGPDISAKGTDEYRNFFETINDALDKTGEDFSYPNAEGLSKEDMAVLTSLNFANPDVNGDKYAGDDKNVNAVGCYEMWPGDFFIQRSGKTKDIMFEMIKDTRRATKNLISDYAKTKDDKILANLLAKSLFNATVSSSNQTSLSEDAIGTLAAQAHLSKFVERHPNLVDMAKESLKDNKAELEKFDKALNNLTMEKNIFKYASKAHDLNATPVERKVSDMVRNLLDFESQEQANFKVDPKPIREGEEKLGESVVEAQKRGADPNEISKILESNTMKLGYLQKSLETTPLRKLFQDEKAGELLGEIAAEVKSLNQRDEMDYDFFYHCVEQTGLIPPRPEFKKDKFGKVIQGKENEAIMDDYYEKKVKMDPKKLVEKATAKFKSVQKMNDKLQSVCNRFVREQGLEFSDVVNLANAKRMSTPEYVCKMYEDNQKAEWDILSSKEKIESLKTGLEIRKFLPEKEALDKITNKIIECASDANLSKKERDNLSKVATDLSKLFADNKELQPLGKAEDLMKVVDKKQPELNKQPELEKEQPQLGGLGH